MTQKFPSIVDKSEKEHLCQYENSFEDLAKNDHDLVAETKQ